LLVEPIQQAASLEAGRNQATTRSDLLVGAPEPALGQEVLGHSLFNLISIELNKREWLQRSFAKITVL